MVKKLTSIGSSVGVIIDKPILELYKFKDKVEITPVEGGLLITPADGGKRQDRVKAALKKGNARYSKALKKLAE